MKLLKNPFLDCKSIREKVNLVASVRSVQKYVLMLGWRKVGTKYYQIVSFDNRVKRYIFCCLCKIFKENYDDVINIQGILDNPSPLRHREKVTDLKSDGLSN